ncbi:MAG: FlaD/FlaE family flagellar protein [Halobacteriales archaeon]|nr:FlaD/FlaE family flagellar protein [Halobacteriales archaeon]
MFESLRDLLSWEPPANDETDESGDEEIEKVDPAPAIVEMDDGEGGDASSNELTARINEIESEVDSTSSSVQAVQSSQDDLQDTVSEMNDTVRELLGVYDQVNAAENPFVEAGEMYDNATASEDSDDGDEGVVSFDDLDDETAPASAATDGVGQAVSVEGTGGPGLGMNEPQYNAMVNAVPDGYAGDVLLMEWLAKLMEKSGPAGALRAVEHYEAVNWVSPPARDRILDCLGGPSLDVFVDPTQPREPTADEHALSHQYLTVLSQLDEV